jgi:two-component system OmpR family response regulator
LYLLLVEDDLSTAAHLKQGLLNAGHQVMILHDGDAALEPACREEFDVAIIDRMLPGLDGLSLVRQMRSRNVQIPVLFLTTLGGIDDRVQGLDAGADDYLVKPFAFAELAARINALGRRARTETVRLECADLTMNLLTREVHRAGRLIELQPREFGLLEFLLRNQGQMVTRKMLLERVWNLHFDPHTNIVESHISRIRGKLEQDGAAALINNVRGQGYYLSAPT